MAEPTLQELAGDFRLSERSISVGLTAQIVAAQDPTRWGLIFYKPNSTNSCFVSTLGTVANLTGILVSQTNVPITLNFRDFGALTQAAWFGVASVAGTLLGVIEVFYRPQGRVPSLDEMYALSAKMGGKR